ncbi:hypothetical protein RchiOBHm_Chr2g0156361 [Rosa chinensis]|uniref:Uncharacterized protein n=1 Tax=Rosa chinensis TaxID=74649 RepID=A0A2P6S1F1_ROSCH|nr:hypothetical protein RchiOBHm_Chr2g0156361 [Rosa chinensis]
MFETRLRLHDCHNPSFVLFLSLTKIAILRWYRPPLEFSPQNWRLGSTYSHLEFFSNCKGVTTERYWGHNCGRFH